MWRMMPFVVVLCLPAVAAAQSLPATEVARTGQDVPGFPGGTFGVVRALPRLGTGGHIAFNGFIVGGGVANANISRIGWARPATCKSRFVRILRVGPNRLANYGASA